MPSETISTEVNDIEKLEEEISKRQKILEKKDDTVSSTNEKDMELFFGDELAAKRKEDELKAREREVTTYLDTLQKKEAELITRERAVAEKEEYVRSREKTLADFEKVLTLKQTEVNQRIEELRKKDFEVRKMLEDYKKTVSETELLKKELDHKKLLVQKSDELAAAEQRIISANQDLALKESRVNRMNEEFEKKKTAYQSVEKELAEKRIKIEDDERKLKIIKDGLETKTKEFEAIFREENDKLQLKADEIEKYVISGAKTKPTAAEPKPAPSNPVFNDPAKQKALDEEAIRKKAIERVEKMLAQERNLQVPIIQDKPTPPETECKSIMDLPDEPATKPIPAVEEPNLAAIVPPAKPPVKEDEDIVAQDRAIMAAAAAAKSKPGDLSQSCKSCEDLLKLVEKDKKIDTRTAAKALNAKEEDINKWAAELKERGVISLHQRFMGGTDLEMTKDAIKKLGEREEDDKIIRIKKELERIREEQKKMRGGF